MHINGRTYTDYVHPNKDVTLTSQHHPLLSLKWTHSYPLSIYWNWYCNLCNNSSTTPRQLTYTEQELHTHYTSTHT